MLRIDNLKKSFGMRVLFQHASYHFPEGERIALVGANGAGKTTMLNILCGLDTPDDGAVLLPKQTTVGYLPQKPNAEPRATVLEECESGATALVALRDQMESAATAGEMDIYEHAESAFRLADGYALAAKAASVLNGLGFKEEELAKHPTALSGGWRMRLELARLFIRAPDFLILDEPTNHLDLPSLVWVEQYLQNFRGTLLFVSHDRSLLNRLATITLHLASTKLTAYRGNFDAFLIAREERLAQADAERDQLRRRREDMERFVERFGAKATKAAQAQSRVKMIARIRDMEESFAPEGSDSSVFIDIPSPPKAPRIVYRIEGGTIGYAVPLSRNVNLQIERGAKIAIIGANGIGKSTLLRTIEGRVKALSGLFEPGIGVEAAFFAQEQTETLDTQDSVLANLLRATDLSEKAARGLLGGFLFRGDDVFKRVGVLSGGEQSRLGLACALARQANLLLLDEPTNHLDMSSVETLAASLEQYDGTVLFVSHDRTFIDSFCTHVFAMLPDGRSMLFEGKLADYARLAEVAGFPNVLRAATPNTGANAAGNKGGASTANPSGKKAATATLVLTDQEAKDLKRQRQKAQARIASLDTEMLRLRDQLVQCELEMSQLPPSDFTGTNALHARSQAAAARLEAAEAEWLAQAEEVEAVLSRLAAAGRE